MRERPIALFDSGSGGLAVLKNLQTQLPNESILYLGDLLHMPYGEKSAESIEKYSLANGKFLEGLGAKLLIVACNTASAIGLAPLKKALSIPVIGLIDPCAKKVGATTKGRVGILATQAVIRSRSYEKAILDHSPSAYILPKACPTLAYLIEQGLSGHAATPFVVQAAIKKFLSEKIDTLVLGCSHYPLIRCHIENALPSSVQIVDSSESCIDEVIATLNACQLIANRRTKGHERFFTSAASEAFQKVAPLFLGRSIPKPEHYQAD